MTTISILLMVIAAVSLVGHYLFALPLVNKLNRAQPFDASNSYCPPATVILCLRGNDPILPQCLENLLTQDYPDYELRIVVDSIDDPAWPVVNETIANYPNVNVTVIPHTERLMTCSRKVSSILQAVASIPDDREVVVQIDADTNAHPTCLRELIAPMADDSVGVTTGNRWYAPIQSNLGSLVRMNWNATVAPWMYNLGLPWGGCVAIRTTLLKHPKLMKRLSRAFTEDLTLGVFAQQQGKRVELVPSLIIANTETSSWNGMLGFVERQYMTVRTCNPRWPIVLAYANMLAPFNVGMVGIFFYGLYLLNPIFIAAPLVFWCGMHVGNWAIARAVRRALNRLNRPLPSVSMWSFLTPISIVLEKNVSWWSINRAHVARSVTWRQIRYEIRGARSLRVILDEPYRELRRTPALHESI